MNIDAKLAQLGLPGLPAPLPSPVIDAHTHVDVTDEYSGLGLADNLSAAAAVGVSGLVQIGCDVASSRWAVEATSHAGVVAAVAIHPNEAARMSDDQAVAALVEIDEMASHLGVRAIGECGLDYFRTDPRTPEGAAGIQRQRWVFRRHVELAHAHGLTLAIHARRAEAKVAAATKIGDALEHVADILDDAGWPERTIFHCYGGDAVFARRALAAGAWLSFAGNVTYKANHDLQEALALAGDDKILVETDAPFLTPLPHRGKRNAPYLLAHTVRFVANHRGMELAECCRQLHSNTISAYGGVWDQMSAHRQSNASMSRSQAGHATGDGDTLGGFTEDVDG